MKINQALTLSSDQNWAWLIAHTLQKPQYFLYTHSEIILTIEQEKLLLNYLQRFNNNEPLAYIIGEQPFHNIILQITPEVLIPRSETELLVEFVLQHFSGQENITLLDLGTGSGAIALALAHAQPTWQIMATDVSAPALTVAQQNAAQLNIHNVTFQQSDWFAGLPPQKFNAIISNPPYIAADDPAIADSVKAHEPHLALFAEQNGLAALEHLISGSKNYLMPGGLVVVEHGYQQGEHVRALLTEHGYQGVITHRDYTGHERFTTASYSKK